MTETEARALLAEESYKVGRKIALGKKLNTWDIDKRMAIVAWINGRIETEAAAIQVRRANNYRDRYVGSVIAKREANA